MDYCLSHFPSPLHRHCFSQVRYRAEWSSETSFRNVLISPRMMVDHMPDVVLRALRSLTRDQPSALCPSSTSNSHLNVIWALTDLITDIQHAYLFLPSDPSGASASSTAVYSLCHHITYSAVLFKRDNSSHFSGCAKMSDSEDQYWV